MFTASLSFLLLGLVSLASEVSAAGVCADAYEPFHAEVLFGSDRLIWSISVSKPVDNPPEGKNSCGKGYLSFYVNSSKYCSSKPFLDPKAFSKITHDGCDYRFITYYSIGNTQRLVITVNISAICDLSAPEDTMIMAPNGTKRIEIHHDIYHDYIMIGRTRAVCDPNTTTPETSTTATTPETSTTATATGAPTTTATEDWAMVVVTTSLDGLALWSAIMRCIAGNPASDSDPDFLWFRVACPVESDTAAAVKQACVAIFKDRGAAAWLVNEASHKAVPGIYGAVTAEDSPRPGGSGGWSTMSITIAAAIVVSVMAVVAVTALVLANRTYRSPRRIVPDFEDDAPFLNDSRDIIDDINPSNKTPTNNLNSANTDTMATSGDSPKRRERGVKPNNPKINTNRKDDNDNPSDNIDTENLDIENLDIENLNNEGMI